MIIWLIGLSGAGKTTIGREVLNLWRQSEPNTVFVDGDEIRSLFGQDQDSVDYSLAGRRRNSERMCRLSQWLDRQGMNAVVCVLSLFEDHRQANRNNLGRYFEVFIDAPLAMLEKRDPKGLYAAARAGKMDNVVGIHIPFPKPATPDMVFDNSTEGLDAPGVAANILARALDEGRRP